MSAGSVSPVGQSGPAEVLSLRAGGSSQTSQSSQAPEVERLSSPRTVPQSAPPPGTGQRVDVVA